MGRLLVFLACMLIASSVGARDGDLSGAWANWQEIGPLANCSAASIDSAVICGNTYGVKVEGYNLLTLEILYTKSAGTGWEFYLEACNEGHSTSDCTDATDWFRVATTQTVAGTGTALTADPIYHVAAASDRVAYSLGINYRRIRLNGFASTGTPDANDKITVNARVSWIPAY